MRVKACETWEKRSTQWLKEEHEGVCSKKRKKGKKEPRTKEAIQDKNKRDGGESRMDDVNREEKK